MRLSAGGLVITARVLASLRNGLAFLLARFRRIVSARRGVPALPGPYPWEASYPQGLDWRVDIAARPLFAVLDDSVARFPDKPCLEFQGKRYSYREVGRLVAKAAKGLQAMGVGKDTRVGLLLPNSPYFVICFHAVLKAGGTVVNFNPLYAEREVARQIADAGVTVMVTMNLAALYPKVANCLADGVLESIVVCRMSGALPFPGNLLLPLIRRREMSTIPADRAHVRFDKLIDNDGRPEPVDIDPAADVAVLQYTGGTTGMPKGAMLTHAALYANTVQTRLWATRARVGEEKMLAVLPLFHVFGMTGVMNVGLYIGAEIVLLPRFKVGDVLRAIDRQRPTVFMGVPTMYSAINAHKELDKYDLTSLTDCISGGAPLPMAVKETFERLTGCILVEGYGLSEAGPVCTVNPFTRPGKAGSIGLPIPGTKVKIYSLDLPGRELPLGETGEICIAGPQVMAGYWNRPEETAACLADGLLRTGDVGYMDADGYVFIIDRIKDLIISGGFNVYPRMVEEAVYLHPAVAETVVCGVPDQHRGEIVKAYVRLRPGAALTAAELRTFLKDKLAPFEVPRRVEFREELPRTLIGKASRRELVAEEIRKAKLEKVPA